MNAQEQRHFDAVARASGTAVWWYQTAAGQRRLAERAGRLVANCGLQPSRVLELGCGDGALSQQVATQLDDDTLLVSVELSFELLRALRAAMTHNGARAPHILQGDAERLPFEDETFDAIIGNAILHHVALPDVVPECVRILRPGGAFVFAEPNLLNPLIFLMKRVSFLKRLLHESPDETAFIRWPLHRDLTAWGLEAVTVEPFDFVFPLTPACLVGGVERLSRGLTRIPGVREFAQSLFICGRKPVTATTLASQRV